MTSSDDFRQLGQDLAAFAPKPEARLGVPTALPLDDRERAQHYWDTYRWHITRTRYLPEWRSITYEWYTAHAPRTALHNKLLVSINRDGTADKLLLGYEMDGLDYEIIYDVQAGTVERVGFMSHAKGTSGQRPHAESPVPFDYVLRRIPVDMTPSFSRPELASV